MVIWLDIPLSPIYSDFNSWLIPSPHVLGSISRQSSLFYMQLPPCYLKKKKKIEIQI